MSLQQKMLKACLAFSPHKEIQAMRSAFLKEMINLTEAKAGVLLGFDATGENLLTLCGYPELVFQKISVAQIQRDAHPLSCLLNADRAFYYHYALDELKNIFFKDENAGQFLIIPAHVGGKTEYNSYFILLCVSHKSLEQENLNLLEAFANFCCQNLVTTLAVQSQNSIKKDLLRTLQSQEQTIKTLPNLLAQRLIGHSPVMVKLRSQIGRFAQSDLAVFINGETGTGKELAARELHLLSPRANKPFIAINMSAFADTLIESELFGYCKGAFTGADKNQEGLIAAANQGTLFLDEIGDMPFALQTKILRVLQEKTYRPLGSTKEFKSDFRLITATHQDLKSKIEAKTFRSDLYYRIKQLHLVLSPLRERYEDIPLLTDYFLQNIASRRGEVKCTLAPEALMALQTHRFPGNIRELQALLEQAVVQCEGNIILKQDIIETSNLNNFDASESFFPLKEACEHFEKEYILRIFKETNGNREIAAQKLQLPLRTLSDKLKRFNITFYKAKE